MVSEDMSIPQEAHPDMAMSSQSSDDNEYLNDEELRSSFFIPGITGRARCLRDIKPLQLSSSSLMTRASRDEKKKKKKISSDKDKKKRSSRHEVSIQELELYESFATEPKTVLKPITRRGGSLQTISDESLTLGASAPLLDVQDIGCQPEDVMNSIIKAEAENNSLIQIPDHTKDLRDGDMDSDSVSLTQNLHNSILHSIMKDIPNRTSSFGSSSFPPSDGKLENKEIPPSPCGLQSMASLLLSTEQDDDNSAASLDLADLAIALNKTRKGDDEPDEDDFKDLSPIDRIYASLSRLDEIFNMDTVTSELMHMSTPQFQRRLEKRSTGSSDLPSIPSLSSHSDKRRRKGIKKKSSSGRSHRTMPQSVEAIAEELVEESISPSRRNRSHRRASVA